MIICFIIFYKIPKIYHYFIAYQNVPFYLKLFLKYTSDLPKKVPRRNMANLLHNCF